MISKCTATTTAQRGVEAKQIELDNTVLGMEMSSSSQGPAESSAEDHSGSYLQVLVEKRGGARLPVSSSPTRALYVLPRRVLLDARCTCHRTALPRREEGAAPAEGGAGEPAGPQKASDPREKVCDVGSDASDDEPGLVEAHYFERGDGAALLARGAAPTALERAARRGTRGARRWLRECGAAPRLLLALPGALLLPALRGALAGARGGAGALVLAASDALLKPALALTFNALVRPALVFVQHVLGAAAGALRPLWRGATDAVEPAARLLAAARLVEVRVECAPRRHA